MKRKTAKRPKPRLARRASCTITGLVSLSEVSLALKHEADWWRSKSHDDRTGICKDYADKLDSYAKRFDDAAERWINSFPKGGEA